MPTRLGLGKPWLKSLTPSSFVGENAGKMPLKTLATEDAHTYLDNAWKDRNLRDESSAHFTSYNFFRSEIIVDDVGRSMAANGLTSGRSVVAFLRMSKAKIHSAILVLDTSLAFSTQPLTRIELYPLRKMPRNAIVFELFCACSCHLFSAVAYVCFALARCNSSN